MPCTGTTETDVTPLIICSPTRLPSFEYWNRVQGSLECIRLSRRCTENGEHFSKNGERFRQNGERFSAAKHPLADIRASVGRQRGKRRACVLACERARKIQKLAFTFTHNRDFPLYKGGWGGYEARKHAHKPSPSLHTTRKVG